MRSGIEGSSTQCACSATLILSCLTKEEERTIGEQHEELDAEILEHYEEGLERERLLRAEPVASSTFARRSCSLGICHRHPPECSTSAEERASTRCH